MCSGDPGVPGRRASNSQLAHPRGVHTLDHTSGCDDTAEEEGRGGASR